MSIRLNTMQSTRLEPEEQSHNVKNTSIDEGVFKKGSVYMGVGKVVCFGSELHGVVTFTG